MAKTFCDLAALSESSTPQLAALLDGADWRAFRPERDLPALRARLARLERDEGVTPLHRLASEHVARGARLIVGARHAGPIDAFALSPCGRYLVTGSDTPAHAYEEGGVLLVWEVASGRVLRSFEGIEGGVGWGDEYLSGLQWGATGHRIGAAFRTNAVGAFDALNGEPFACEANLTPFWDSPPAWCFSPNEDRLFVATWGEGESPGGVVPLDKGGSFDTHSDEVRWLRGRPEGDDAPRTDGLQPYKWARWSPDGAYVYGHNKHGQAYAIDVTTGALRYLTRVEPPVAWSPDGACLVHSPAGLALCDGATGLPIAALPKIVGADQIVFSPGGERMAVVVPAGNAGKAAPGVHVVEGGAVRRFFGTRPVAGTWMLADAQTFAFRPDGARGACLNELGAIEVWSVDEGATPLVTIEGADGVCGLLWGADDVIVGVGPNEVSFWDAASGALRARRTMLSPAGSAGPPAELSPYEAGAGVVALPTEQGWVWAACDEGGDVVCPPEAREAFAHRASFVTEGRLAWPWHWAVGTPRTRLHDAPHSLPPGAPLRSRLRAATPAPADPFFTVEAGDPRPKGDDHWAKTIHEQRQQLILEAQLLSYELPALPITHYRATPLFEGAAINRARLAPYVGKVVMFAESWRPEYVTIGVLAALHDGHLLYRQESKGSSGGGAIRYAELAWLGPAVPLAR